MLKHTPFDTILIANRGEIACRIIRTISAMGLKSVSIYSDADKHAKHVKLADQAIHIGASEASKSYLDGDVIIAAARHAGAQAIHPGYGFLSENADFAQACITAGLIFIGPSPATIALMGDKARAKQSMTAAHVPCIPGYQDDIQDDATLVKQATHMGFPVMIKASAGGGGRGMRRVDKPSQLTNALQDARAEAMSAFGSDRLILEKVIDQSRHVEIQILADSHGHIIHIGERDCSVQRRYQKVIEEAPCPVLTSELRKSMGEAAIKAARHIGYVGAGTVEFILTPSEQFYFLEMNTRLQVEHPVTEMISGLDLVALQIEIAWGRTLNLTQADINFTGHAIEARLYAEDPQQDFLPMCGEVALWQPALSPAIRIDDGIENRQVISPFYDPMIAKIIAHGKDRDTARCRLIQALENTHLFGFATNRSFLIDVLTHPAFINNQVTTTFIQTHSECYKTGPVSKEALICTALLQYISKRHLSLKHSLPIATDLLNWTSASPMPRSFIYKVDDKSYDLSLTALTQNDYKIVIESENYRVRCTKINSFQAHIYIDQERLKTGYYIESVATLHLSLKGRNYVLTNENEQLMPPDEPRGEGKISAPIHGTLQEVFVRPGDKVHKGQRLAILEAMKMQHEITADITGSVLAVHVQPGAHIAAKTLMIEITDHINA